VREASTALLVANMPMCWALMRRIFKLRAFNGITSSNGLRSRSKSVPIATSYTGTGLSRVGVKVKSIGTTSTASRAEGGNTSWWDREPGLTRSESEERIVGSSNTSVPLEILTLREVDIDRGSVREPIGVNGKVFIQSNSKMFDGNGRDYETKTTITTLATQSGRKSESGSR
jgi:hypothetical protein